MKLVRTTIVEPFPVFYSHVNHASHRKCGDPANPGPFYAAGSSWTTLYSERNLKWKLASAEFIRRDGYTVKIDVIDRVFNVDTVILSCPNDFKQVLA